MRIPRIHTQPDGDVFENVRFRAVMDESGLEHMVPAVWSGAAAEILLAKVFHRAPLPATRAIEETGVPAWLRRHENIGDGGHVFEIDFRDVLHRVAGGWTYRGWQNGIFDSDEEARAFYDETRYLLLHRLASPEISLWARSGLDWAYGIETTPAPRQRIADFDGRGKNALKRARLLDDALSLEDAPEKTGVTLPVENAGSADFINWKRAADIDKRARNMGRRVLQATLNAVMDACERGSVFGFDPAHNYRLARALETARTAGADEALLRMAVSYAQQGFESVPVPKAEEDGESLVFATLSLPDEFVEAALTGHGFMLYDGDTALRRASASRLWDGLAEAVWASGEPAVFFRDSAGGENTCPSRSGGFIFSPGAAAPSAALDLPKFRTSSGLNVGTVRHAATLMTLALDAEASGPGRPVALGVTGIAALLMGQGIAYDSDEGRGTAAAAVSLVSASAHIASADMAARAGAFANYANREKEILQSLKDKTGSGFAGRGAARRPTQLQAGPCPDAALAEGARDAWREAYAAARDKGLRHAHLTGIDAEAGAEILLGASTRGIAPEINIVRFGDDGDGALYGKKLNPLVPQALKKLGYGPEMIDTIHFHAVGHGTLLDAPHVNHKTLKTKGFHQAALDALEFALKSAQHIRYAFNRWTLGSDFCRHMLGFSDEQLDSGTFDMLGALGFTADEIDDANLYCCGAGTLEGSSLEPRHLAVFDCSGPCGSGVRRVSPDAQIKMQAAVEPFLSGGCAHTVELHADATIDEVQKLLLRGWELGLRRLRLWRDENAPLMAAVIVEREGEEKPAAVLKKAVS